MPELKYDADGIVMHFRKELDMEDPEELQEFIKGHERYNLMNSWNRCTSYANCVKISHLPLTHDQASKAYELIDCEDFWFPINDLMREWAIERKHEWSVGFNGRSGGYIVLYKGGMKDGRPFTWPGKSVDEELDFEGWELVDFQDKAKFILEFDLLCDTILTELVYYIENYDVKDEVVQVPKTVKVLVEKQMSDGGPPYDAATATGMYDHDDTN
jgi:hypothetical protein